MAVGNLVRTSKPQRKHTKRYFIEVNPLAVSVALPTAFLWGGKRHSDPVAAFTSKAVTSRRGVVPRVVYHRVAALENGQLTGAARINLTFRKVF